MHEPYLLLTFIPVFRDGEGGYWTDRLWQRDLVRHFDYIPHLRLVCPVRALDDAAGVDLAAIDVPEDCRLEVRELPWSRSLGEALRDVPRTVLALDAAIRDAGLVHSGIVGWPYPLGWVANAIAIARRKPLVLVVESTPWRLTGTRDERPVHALRAALTEMLGRFFVNRADVIFFTHDGYRTELSTGPRGRTFVTPATWIDESDVLPREEAERAWARRRAEPTRFVYPSRLVPEKGTDTLLDALDLCERRLAQDPQRIPVRVDVIGTGTRKAAFEQAALRLRHVELRVLEPVPYGTPFFRFLDGYHAVLAPQLGDEQPRIVFDASARALPVLASTAPGLAAFVEDGRTGRLHERGDARELAALLEWSAAHPGELERMGLAAREQARTYTHRAMHEARARVLALHYARSISVRPGSEPSASGG